MFHPYYTQNETRIVFTKVSPKRLTSMVMQLFYLRRKEKLRASLTAIIMFSSFYVFFWCNLNGQLKGETFRCNTTM